MKVLVLADSHGDISLLKQKLNQIKDLQLIIHLGDHDFDCEAIKKITNVRIEAVRGNNDFGSRQLDDKIIYLEGHKIFITHGHKYGVHGGTGRLYYRALELGADLALYGHTHRFHYEKDEKLMIINPSSLSLSRDGHNSFVILTIDKEGISYERICQE